MCQSMGDDEMKVWKYKRGRDLLDFIMLPLPIVLIGGLVAGWTMVPFLIPPTCASVWDLEDRFKRRFLHA